MRRQRSFALRSATRSVAALSLLALAALAPAARADRALTARRAAALEEVYRLTGPSLALSRVYHSLPDAQRHALLAKVRQMVLAQLPPGFEEHPALEGLPPATRRSVKTLIELAKAVTPEQLDAFVETRDLDHLAPLPPEIFRGYHQQAMSEPIPGTSTRRQQLARADARDREGWRGRARSTDGYRHASEAPPREVTLLGADDPVPPEEVPVDRTEPAFDGLGAKVTRIVDLPDHVLANSARLARALNHLTNGSYQEEPLAVHLPGFDGEVRDGVELVNALLATGRLDLAVFDARMFVNFVDLWVPHGESVVPVRIPTWIRTGVDPMAPEAKGPAPADRQLLLPANHAEHLLVCFEKGTARPAAMVKWYMGIPAAGPLQGTMYKPAVTRRASWSGFRIVNAYGSEPAVRQMVRSGGLLMKLYNFVQDRYHLRANGYAVVGVCNDTTGLLEGVLQGQTGRSTVWPLVRDPQLDFYYAAIVEPLGLRMQTGAGGIPVLNIPSDARLDHYPWLTSPRVTLHRLGANVPVRDPAELHLPLLRGWVEALRERSSTFARALAMQSVH